MELTQRKKQILRAIISDYICTAEPIGSKALAAKPELSYSSATIRNEMSELEEMGYLEKPHTSAGRIPSQKGYRLYVDQLMTPTDDSTATADTNALMQLKSQELDRLIQEAGKLISSLTDYATVAVTPQLSRMVIRKFEIISVDKTTFVIVIVTESGMIKNKLVHTKSPVEKDAYELLAYVLNQTLTGVAMERITPERFDIVQRAAGASALLAPVASYIAELMQEVDSQQVYLEGANKLLRFPEYRDPEKAQALLDYLVDDSAKLVPSKLVPVTANHHGVQIYIGAENGRNPLAETSTIYAKYNIGNYGQGMIGIVGPTRMDYAALSVRLEAFAKGLNQLIAETFHEDGNPTQEAHDGFSHPFCQENS